MFDFERLHQAARDARAKGQSNVLLPHGEFRRGVGDRCQVDRTFRGDES